MLTSLFGDLGSVLDPFGKKSRAAEEAGRPFAAPAPEPEIPADMDPLTDVASSVASGVASGDAAADGAPA